MKHVIDIQFAATNNNFPKREQLTAWTQAALEHTNIASELTIRIVDEEESEQLNKAWREKKGPTNVLSFPADITDEIQPRLLGDIVICAPVVSREAREQDKIPDAHWAHMVIHGTLHLLGYDHIEDADAESMERLEIDILNTLNIEDPYN